MSWSEKIISALVAADVTEARHLLVIFGADIGKAVGSILHVPADYFPEVVAVISAFLKDLPHLADVEVRLRDDVPIELLATTWRTWTA